MSEQQGCTEVNYSRSLMFHGLGKEYFRLCIVNLLLIIVTLGVFAPWAFVRSKQYLYSHTELSGSRFSYNAKGGSIFVSWVFVGVFLLSLYMSIYHHASALSWCLVALIVLFLPWFMMRSIRYQMQSTMLNNVRFNFKCSGLKAWWVVLGCPVLLFSAVYFICIIVMSIGFCAISFNVQNMMIVIAMSMMFAVFGVGIAQGITSALWLRLFFSRLSFGKQNFSAEISIRKCIKIILGGILVLLPLLIAVAGLNFSWLVKGVSATRSGYIGSPYTLSELETISFMVQISYYLYFFGAVLCWSYIYVTLRDYYFNSVVLSEKIVFRSTLTVTGFIIQLVINSLLTVCTLGLGYPWARVRYCRYLANNTWLDGDLDALDLQDHDDKIATDILSRISCGIVPNISL
ncbi:YjgN family protein [Buttiauxella noackiae]|uniref:YjgN family protein n=1 Tax=Buttiauxella noackiae TaxID=82992 RepID=UPI0005517832|nr:DUF898 family protein [Buttiauxella noackiae]